MRRQKGSITRVRPSISELISPVPLVFLRSFQIFVEPRDGAAHYIFKVLGLRENVAFVFVDDELGFDAESFEGVPEFVGLRGGAFAVAIADHNERGRFRVLDKSDG